VIYINKVNRKKILIYLYTLLILFNFSNKEKLREKNEIDTTKELYGQTVTYSNGNIYFCDSVIIANELSKICDETDVVIIDQSYLKDPNIKILSSYKIINPVEMEEVLKIIKQYSNQKDTNWDRSIESMYNEWLVHNICSNFSIRNDRTNDVDLNNADEEVYKSKIISKLLGN